MALFRYLAVSQDGRKFAGMLNADSFDLAKERLRKQKILVTELKFYKKKGREKVLSPSLLVNFTRDLHVLLRAGLPLYESLLTIEEKYNRTKAHPLFLDLCDQVKQGRHLSQALSEYSKDFDAVYLSLVKAGEESGDLEESFKELNKLIGQEQSLRKKASTAMMYPIFLGSFCLLVLCALLFFLIPNMRELFEGRTLHPMTSFILNFSQALNDHALIIFSSLVLLVLFLVSFLRRKQGKRFIKGIGLRIPILKRLMTEIILARFSRVFSVLLRGGIPLPETLGLARKVMNNPFFEEIMLQAEKKVLEGKKMSEELKKSPLIPRLIIRMLAIAEESGNIADMMQNIAEIYEEDVERSLSRLTSMIQPIMLLFLGLIVGVILLAVLLPLTDVSSFIQ